MAQKKVPFRKWVPFWLRAVVGFAILLPIMMINGAYTGSSVDISSALGVLSEDISMGYYAASAGMAVAYPIIPKIRPIVTTKTILLCGLMIQVMLSLLCAVAESMNLIIICSFLIGFFKAFALMELIIILKPIFSPKDVRSEFYAYFYPTVFGIGQISMILTAEMAYNYRWQYMYYFVTILLLIAIILVLICFRYGHRPIHIPYKDVDGRSVLLISTIILSIIYVCTYGRTKDWFESRDIALLSVAVVPLLYIFIRRQQTIEKPYINLEVLKSKKAIVGYFFMSVVMILSSSSALISSYSSSVLKVNSLYSNGLNLVMIPGFILGAIVCFWWFRWQIWRFRVLVFWGMMCYVLYFGIIYFGLTPEGTYEFLFVPMFFRGMGMMILFIAFGVYAVEQMNPKLMICNAFFLVAFRSVLAPVVGSSLFSNLLYRGQQRGIMELSEELDMQNPLLMSRYNEALHSALAQGDPIVEAEQIATNTIYSAVNVQAIMVTIKEVIGICLIFSIILMVVSRFIPFHKTLKVKVVKSGSDMI